MSDERPIDAKPLGVVNITRLSDDEAALALITTDKNASVYLINAEGLAAILPPLLGAASGWAGRPHLENEKVFGRGNAMLADTLAIGRGIHDSECAVSLRLGQLELTFLVPLEQAIGGCAQLAHIIEPIENPPKPN